MIKKINLRVVLGLKDIYQRLVSLYQDIHMSNKIQGNL